MTQQTDALQTQLNEYLEAYEIGREVDENSDLSEFLPAAGHPLYLETRRELVRMDLEYGWTRGKRRRVADYVAVFPDLLNDPVSAQEITFEEYRLRMLAGEKPSAAEYERVYGVRTHDWPGSDTHIENYAKTVVSRCDEFREDLLDTFKGRPQTPAVEWDMHDEAFPPLDKNNRGSLSAETARVLLQHDVVHSHMEVSFLLIEALTSLPDVGTWFLNFHLIAVLGEGGFGRVYLARQGGLANRLVALKITINLQGEEQKLAQLQHTNVVPIYSAHKEGTLYAVCMPYFGPTTLADVVRRNRKEGRLPTTGATIVETLRRRESEFATKCEPAQQPSTDPQRTHGVSKLEESDYVGAVLWLAERITDGLIHAHEYGILHGDLKPANILLTDDGEPMLLDFNLATDLKIEAGLAELRVGGTIPYMAPEHLQALKGGDRRRVDARSDVYSLGVILFELLTGRLPFRVPPGPMFEILPGMITERMQGPPRMRQYNKAVSYAVESIVRHCLHPDPSKRYQSVQELHDDLQRHRQNLPLQHAPEVSLIERGQKWVRRHPRLAAPNTIIMVLVCMLAMVLAPGAWDTWQQWQADRQKLHDARVQADLSEFEKEDARKKKELAEQLAEREKKNTQEAKESARIVQERIDALNRYRRFHAAAVVSQDLLDCVALMRMRPGLADIEKGRLDRLDHECRTLLKDYDVVESADWQLQPRVTALPELETQKLRADVAGLLFALAEAEAQQAAGSSDEPARKRPAVAMDFNNRARACFSARAASCALVLQQEKLVRLAGRDEEAALLKVDAEKLVSDYEKASRQLHMTDDKDKADAIRARLKIRDDTDFYWTALELASRRRYDKAGATLAEATRRFPSHFGAWQLWALCHQATGECSTSAKKLDHFRDALSCWNVCAALRPDRSDVLYWRGMVAIHLDKQADARSDFERLTRPSNEEDPYWIPALYQDAVLLAAKSENEQNAYVKLNQILARDKEHVDARLMRGVIKARRELRDEAVEEADLALKRPADHTPARYYQAATIYALNAGTVLDKKGEDGERAVELLSKAIQGGHGAKWLDADANLRRIRDLPEFRKLVEEAGKID